MTGFVGRICFRHRWLVILAWVVIATGGGLASGPVFERMSNGGGKTLAGTETGEAYELFDSVSQDGGSVIALWENVSPPSVASNVERARADIAALEGVMEVRPPRPATDGSGLALEVVFTKDAKDSSVDAVSTRLRGLAGEVAGSSVRLGGDKVLREQIGAKVQQDLGRAEVSSLPLTVLIMIFVFGGVLAAGLPLLATLATVAGAFAVLLGFSEIVDLDPDIISVVSMMGLALCIDYSLLLVARYREELASGHPPGEALVRTWLTAGRTISFSALTVAAALSGLLFIQVTDLQAMGAAGISATVVALLSALTLTAALLRVFGRWIKPPRARKAGKARRPDGFFARLAAVTQRRPLLFFLGTAAALLALGSPLIGASVRLPDMEGLPRSIESVAVYDTMAASYGANQDPAVALLSRADMSTLDTWAAKWRTDPAVAGVDPAREVAPGLSYITFRVHGDAQAAGARDLVARMRAAKPPGGPSWVIGEAAAVSDIKDKIVEGLPMALSVIAVAMFLLLFLMTGSLVVPLKALVMNVISLGAAFGVLVAVFEHGWLAGPLDTLTVGGLSPFVIVLVFAFGFGLSMDYEVFLLARIKERVDAGEPTDVAVRQGLQHSGRIITSAALLMLVVFGFFAAAQIGDIEQIGLGLFVAVLIDATLVRCLLVPATMTLLGRWNWWAPSPLRRLRLKPA
ncbi:MAG TPA: MMPL family transporter [Candidatus Limnocylindrales bacterium]|nr:MMPL family transporter [Candidatus Limnocylindrales bacterium]